MTILRREDIQPQKRQIDLCGPEGNIFVILGICARLAKRLNLDWATIQNDAMSGEYDHAIEVLDKHFGLYIDFIR